MTQDSVRGWYLPVVLALALMLPTVSGNAVIPPDRSGPLPGIGGQTGEPAGPVVAFSVPVGLNPSAIAYVGAEGELFVTNSGSNNVSVINDTLGTTVASISVGVDPSAILDLGGYVYVTNELSNNVSVIDSATLRVVSSIPVGGHPDGIAPAPYYDEIVVANAATNNVTVVDVQTNSTVANVGVGSDPDGATGVPGYNELYFTDAGNANVTPFRLNNDTTNATSIPVGANPGALVIGQGGPETNWQSSLFVANNGSDNVSIINIETRTGNLTTYPLASVSVGSGPDAMVFDPADGRVYVANGLSDNISIISGAGSAIISPGIGVGQDPDGIAYDSANGCLYIANRGSGNVSVACNLMAPSNQGSIPLSSPGGIAYDSGNGNLYVSTGDDGAAVINGSTDQVVVPDIVVGSSYPDWTDLVYDPGSGYIFVTSSVNDTVSMINGTTNLVSNGTISLGQGPYDSPEGIAYDSANGFVYVRLAGDYLAVINGSSGTVEGSIDVGYAASSPYLVYDSTNRDLYVEAMDSTGQELVRVINGSGPAINGSNLFIGPGIQVGQNAGGMLFDPENGYIYVWDVPPTSTGISGNLSIINGSTNALLSETIPVPYWGSAAVYDNASGLMYWLGDWNVTVVDPVNGSVVGTLGVGALPSAIAFDSANGNLYVTNPGENNVTVIYAHPPTVLSSVAFIEHGDPSGTTWGVTIDGSSETSNTSEIDFRLSGGPYAYTIQAPGGYVSLRSAGHVIASRTLALVPVIFAANRTGTSTTLRSLSLKAPSSVTGPGGSLDLVAIASCTPAPCPTGAVAFSWSLNNSLGTLNSTTGSSVQFTAGPEPGVSLVIVRATLGNQSAMNSTTLTVLHASPGTRSVPPSSPSSGGMCIALGAAVGAVFAAAMVIALRRRRKPPLGTLPPSAL